jgi:hypothetical protein
VSFLCKRFVKIPHYRHFAGTMKRANDAVASSVALVCYILVCVSRISPTLEGFRAAFRRPSLTLAEIAWRWTVSTTACALLIFGVLEYLDTLPVTDGEVLLLRTRHPVLVGQAIAHILRGSLNRVVAAGLVAALALTGLWILAASVGRTATVRALLEYFGERRDAIAGSYVGDFGARSGSFGALLGLNFLRAAVVLAVILGLQASAILAGFASPTAHPRPGLAFMLFLPLAALVCLLAWVLNWFLSLASVFAVRDSGSTLNALSSAVAFFRDRLRPVFAVSTWTGLAHVAVFIGAASVVSMPLAFVQVVPARLVIAVMIVMTMAYFAIADWLYMARLAGYVCIAEMPEALLAPVPPAPLPTPPLQRQQLAPTPIQTTIDPDELILSDVPSPAAST